jgi:hypothetical protein
MRKWLPKQTVLDGVEVFVTLHLQFATFNVA